MASREVYGLLATHFLLGRIQPTQQFVNHIVESAALHQFDLKLAEPDGSLRADPVPALVEGPQLVLQIAGLLAPLDHQVLAEEVDRENDGLSTAYLQVEFLKR